MTVQSQITSEEVRPLLPASHEAEGKTTRRAALFRRAFALHSGQRGFTLVEVMVSVAILGLIGPAFLLALQTSTRTIQIVDEQIQAEAIARTQLEVIKAASYQDCDPTPCYSVIPDIPFQYLVSIDVVAIDSVDCLTDGNCNTLQQVTVTIARPTGDGPDRRVIAVSAYKMKR